MATYEQAATIATDQAFIDRVTACGVQQAGTFVNDSRPEFKLYAEAVITSEANARQLVWPVACGPNGETAQTNDDDLRAAVQAVWPLIGASYVPVTP